MSADAAPPLRADAEVRANRDEGGGNFRLRLAVAGWPGARPGHFVMLSPGARSGALRFDPLLPRPMAVYRTHAGTPPEIEILYKAMGRGTRLLAETRAGDFVRVVGPLGVPFALPDRGSRALLVGGGTGIASLYELAAEAAAHGPVVVMLGARSAIDLMGADDFAALGVDVRVATEDGSRGHRGRVTELLEAAVAEDGDAVVYACGPTPMMRRAAEIAAARGRACQVSLENHMACGFGVCLGCAVPRADGTIALVCRDGPVFEAARVGWAGVP
jgi:dihydroorotate dehydrogenase electron transfer subunit